MKNQAAPPTEPTGQPEGVPDVIHQPQDYRAGQGQYQEGYRFSDTPNSALVERKSGGKSIGERFANIFGNPKTRGRLIKAVSVAILGGILLTGASPALAAGLPVLNTVGEIAGTALQTVFEGISDFSSGITNFSTDAVEQTLNAIGDNNPELAKNLAQGGLNIQEGARQLGEIVSSSFGDASASAVTELISTEGLGPVRAN